MIRGDRDGEKADLIDGSIGEASMYHETFGFYAQGVSIETAVTAPGWQERLVRCESPATNRGVARCLSPEDLFVSKALAGRPKDLEFCRSVVDVGAVGNDLARTLINKTDAVDVEKDLARGLPSSDS